MWLKCCCSDCTGKMHYNVKLKMLCISGKYFLHSGFWHLPKYKIQKPHEMLVQRGHHFPLTTRETEAGDKKHSMLMPGGIPSTDLQGHFRERQSTRKGHMDVDNLCLLGQDLTVLVQCFVTFTWLWSVASSCPASSEHNQRNVVFSPVFVGDTYLLCYYEI